MVMSRSRICAVFLAAFSFAAGSAAVAEVQKGMHIFSACRGVNVHYCQGYISAIADEMSGGVEFRNYRACIPQDVRIGHLRLVVSKWLGDHLEYRHDPGAGLVAEALANEYPCQ